MKSILLFVLVFLSIGIVKAQEVAKVTVSSTAPITDILEKVKLAGKTLNFGSRNYLATEKTGKITLWQTVGRLDPADFFCQVDATFKNGTTTLVFSMPHNPKLIANYVKELKKIIKELELPNMMVGEYFDGIE
jgi:hypothetical protein